MSGTKDPSPSKQSLKDKGEDFAIELQPTNKNAGGAKTDDLFGASPGDSNIPKKAPPPKKTEGAGDAGGNASDDGFENKFEDQTKKKVTKKKKKAGAGGNAGDEEA